METLGPDTALPSPEADLQVEEAVGVVDRTAQAALENMQNYLLGRRETLHFYFDLTEPEYVAALAAFQKLGRFNLDDGSLTVIETGHDKIEGRPVPYEIIDVAHQQWRIVRAKKSSYTYTVKEEGKEPQVRTDRAVMFYSYDARTALKNTSSYGVHDFH